MNAENQAHLERIVSQVSADIRAKYEKGQREHGGNLWLKPRMLENAIEEVLDLCVYLYTLREQIESTTKSSSARSEPPVRDALEVTT